MKKIHVWIGKLMCWSIGKIVLIVVVSTISIIATISYYEVDHISMKDGLLQAVADEMDWREFLLMKKYGIYEIDRIHINPTSKI